MGEILRKLQKVREAIEIPIPEDLPEVPNLTLPGAQSEILLQKLRELRELVKDLRTPNLQDIPPSEREIPDL
jgi:hypothetical protein